MNVRELAEKIKGLPQELPVKLVTYFPAQRRDMHIDADEVIRQHCEDCGVEEVLISFVVFGSLGEA